MTGSVRMTVLGVLAALWWPQAILQAQSPSRSGGKIELTALGGYQFGGGVGTAAGDLHLDGNVHYGGILGFRVRPDGLVELSYNYLGTTVGINDRPAKQQKRNSLLGCGARVCQPFNR